MLTKEDYLKRIELARDAILDAGKKNLSSGLDAAVEACPEWDLGRLIGHQGFVFHFATAGISLNGEIPERDSLEKPPEDGGETLLNWFSDSAEQMLNAFKGAELDQPAWNWTSAPDDATFWFRRQTHEAAIHAYDAKLAVGEDFEIGPEWGADGVDEYLMTLFSGHFANQQDIARPEGSFHLHCTDTEGEWFCELEGENLNITREHTKGDAAVQATGNDLMLAVWQRLKVGSEKLEIHGDEAVAKQWLAFSP